MFGTKKREIEFLYEQLEKERQDRKKAEIAYIDATNRLDRRDEDVVHLQERLDLSHKNLRRLNDLNNANIRKQARYRRLFIRQEHRVKVAKENVIRHYGPDHVPEVVGVGRNYHQVIVYAKGPISTYMPSVVKGVPVVVKRVDQPKAL